MTPASPKQITRETFFTRAADIATYYGFQPLPMLLERANERAARRKRTKVPTMREKVTNCDELFTEIATVYATKHLNRLSKPLLIYHSTLDAPADARRKRPKRTPAFALEIIGTDSSIAEALILHVARVILAEAGVRDSCVALNGVGDRESITKFNRELTNYFRKNLQALPATCRQAFKRDAFDALECVREHSPALLDSVPKPMQFLSEESRTHLKTVLEFLESAGTPYELDETLVGPRECYTQTTFELRQQDARDEDAEIVHAHGGRYDDLLKRMYKVDGSVVGIVIDNPVPRGRSPRSMPTKKPKAAETYFIQLGAEAKQKSLLITEALRRAKISVRQSLLQETLSEQLETAERLGVPYVLIMGQKEATEDVVIVRDMETRAQETVPAGDLPNHLKEKAKKQKQQ